MIPEVEFPDLFPNINQGSPAACRAYVEGVLVGLVKEGRFVLTHVLAQPFDRRDLAINVLCGQGVSDGSDGYKKKRFHSHFPIPPELEDLTVELESVQIEVEGQVGKEGDPDYYEGEEHIRPNGSVVFLDGMEPLKSFSRVVGKATHAVPRQRERVRDYKKQRVEMPAAKAIAALLQKGCYLAPDSSRSIRRKHWRLREVNPLLPWYEEPKGKKKAE